MERLFDTGPTDEGFLGGMIRARTEAVAVLDPALLPPATPRVRERSFADALTDRADVGVICEVKKASPSVGPIAPEIDVAVQARAYEKGGAAAVSVLTEPAQFGGCFEDLLEVSAAVNVPVLCKDFVVDPLQIETARAVGADAVLLMVAVLGERLPDFVRLASDAGLEPLVEVHGKEEYALARESGARVIGVNSRDLRTLEVDVERSLGLVQLVSAEGFVAVAESGVKGRPDVRAAARSGADAVLVGEYVMRAADPAGAVEGLTGVRGLGRGDRSI